MDSLSLDIDIQTCDSFYSKNGNIPIVKFVNGKLCYYDDKTKLWEEFKWWLN
jgi:hypothetical protein